MKKNIIISSLLLFLLVLGLSYFFFNQKNEDGKVKCGNKVCSGAESEISCPNDCKKNITACEKYGSTCKNRCDDGENKIETDCGKGGLICCRSANLSGCAQEGDGLGSGTPVEGNCCEGLQIISDMWTYDSEKNECMGINMAGHFCGNCGNSVCSGHENPCNCPQDCGYPDNCAGKGKSIAGGFICCKGLTEVAGKEGGTTCE
jgi:hypothetical protein